MRYACGLGGWGGGWAHGGGGSFFSLALDICRCRMRFPETPRGGCADIGGGDGQCSRVHGVFVSIRQGALASRAGVHPVCGQGSFGRPVKVLFCFPVIKSFFFRVSPLMYACMRTRPRAIFAIFSRVFSARPVCLHYYFPFCSPTTAFVRNSNACNYCISFRLQKK